jgi:hypothetical protein
LQSNGYTYGIKSEVVAGYDFRDYRCYFIQADGGFVDLLDEHKTKIYVLNTLSQYMEHPKKVHLVTTKHVMRYLKGTLDYGLMYVTDHEFRLYGYSDSDWANSISDRKSTSTYFFSLGSSMVSWNNKKQLCVVLSTSEADYVEECATRREVVWLQKLMTI